jgi:anti-sigma factor RsiW
MNCKEIDTFYALYCSGELDSSRALNFVEHLRTCKRCAGHVDQQLRLDAALRSSVLSGEIDTSALDERIHDRIANEHRFRRPGLAVAAGITAAFLLSVVTYRTVFVSQPPPVCVDAARDHLNEVTLRQPRHWISDPAAVAELARLNGVAKSVVNVLAPEGYRLEHAKLCRLNKQIFLHLIYANGRRNISIYVRSRKDELVSGEVRSASGRSVYEVDAGREHIAYFQAGQLTALLVTDESREAALSFAQSAARAL